MKVKLALIDTSKNDKCPNITFCLIVKLKEKNNGLGERKALLKIMHQT